MAKKEKEIDDFAIPLRTYTEIELQDFHTKIQKFWGEPRQVVLPAGLSGTAQKFHHEELHVAYGAARKVQHGKTYAYLYNSRYQEFDNIWKQYEEWRKKQDWIETAQKAEAEKSEANW